MKTLIYLAAFVLLTSIGSCEKPPADTGDCESNQTTKVTFTNSGTGTLKVEVAKTFNSKYEPVDAILVFDVAAGASATKEFKAGRYFVQWKENCPTCAQKAFYAKTFEACAETTETQ